VRPAPASPSRAVGRLNHASRIQAGVVLIAAALSAGRRAHALVKMGETSRRRELVESEPCAPITWEARRSIGQGFKPHASERARGHVPAPPLAPCSLLWFSLLWFWRRARPARSTHPAMRAAAATGRDLAERLCTNCHAVTAQAHAPMRTDVAIPSIAKQPGVTREMPAASSSPIRPCPACSPPCATCAIIAYIWSLKRTH